MTSPDPQTAVRGLFEAFATRDVDAALALTDPQVEWFPEGTGSRSGRRMPYRGHEGMRLYFADVAALWDELSIEPGHLRVAGNGVIVFGQVRGRLRGEVDVLERPVIYVFKLRDGRLLSGRVAATATEAAAVAAAP